MYENRLSLLLQSTLQYANKNVNRLNNSVNSKGVLQKAIYTGLFIVV